MTDDRLAVEYLDLARQSMQGREYHIAELWANLGYSEAQRIGNTQLAGELRQLRDQAHDIRAEGLQAKLRDAKRMLNVPDLIELIGQDIASLPPLKVSPRRLLF